MFVSTAAQIYTGVKVIAFVGHWKDAIAERGDPDDPRRLLLLECGLINLEAFIANRLVDACCTEEGFLGRSSTRTASSLRRCWPRV